MRANPEPDDIIFLDNANGAVVFGDSYGKYRTGGMDLLKVEARVVGGLWKIAYMFAGPAS